MVDITCICHGKKRQIFFLLCKARLTSLLHRLKKNPKLCAEYDKIIKDQEAEGTIEEVVNEIGQAGGGHYMPHREVIRNERETTNN